jgi:hypothetical protein
MVTRLQTILAASAAVCLVGLVSIALGAGDDDASAVFGVKMPSGYRDWPVISVAHEAGKLNDLRAVLGNELALKAYREKAQTFPNGAIIARLAWKYVPSAENNAVFGQEQSFVAGPPTNVQFMVKDSKKYASTGGWGFGQFENGKPNRNEALIGACFPCHVPVKARDYVFTRYAP